ncbi:hypothetical protein [Flagellimonas sp. S3867]|uniref:hypothetical protein n=1 Tax=Flagellimonas sp. S3867 TaxID=2768063 RepID=UPI001688F98B|nr:hypothetical protein [Flagellimonas sp. S3867]
MELFQRFFRGGEDFCIKMTAQPYSLAIYESFDADVEPTFTANYNNIEALQEAYDQKVVPIFPELDDLVSAPCMDENNEEVEPLNDLAAEFKKIAKHQKKSVRPRRTKKTID